MLKSKLLKSAVSFGLFISIGWSSLGPASMPKAEAATAATEELIAIGSEFLGVPYRFGAPTGITSAFDCSSFVQYVYLQSGIELQRTSRAQANVGTKVDKGYLSKGDLVFFNTSGKGISHVGIYAGDNKMLHSSSSKGITLSKMNTNYWNKRYVTARRVL
ncbi:NlpC/P60 family protein [Paenibacillaceae bacterium]|nr:NlpC/P60 family protein [Paenibacillaceae bacterium]